MALITKTIVACNKCGKEVVWDGSNVRVLDEEFYLCDDCLERLINWLTVKSEPVVEEPKNIEVKEEVKEKVSRRETLPTFVPNGRPSTHIQWDEYNINRLLDMWGHNYKLRECGAVFKVGISGINKMLVRIREAQPGSNLYPYQARLKRLDTMRRGKNKEQED